MNNGKIKSEEIALKVLPSAMKFIVENGGKMRVGEIEDRLKDTLKFTDYEKEELKSGGPRWLKVLSFYSIEAVKAGFLVKDRGSWIITKEGEEALAKGDQDFMSDMHKAYGEWSTNKDEVNVEGLDVPASLEDEKETIDAQYYRDQLQRKANDAIREHVRRMDPYEFQNLVAALLRAMGYYTTFVAPKGPDGGVDIIANPDPLGISGPRLMVQVKHWSNTKVPVQVVRELAGVMESSDAGLVVTSGGFTRDAFVESQKLSKRIRLIDFDEFVELWKEYYPKMNREDRMLLPLEPIYVLSPKSVD